MNLFIYLFIIQNVRNNYDVYLFIPCKVDFLRQTKENAICGLQPSYVFVIISHCFTISEKTVVSPRVWIEKKK